MSLSFPEEDSTLLLPRQLGNTLLLLTDNFALAEESGGTHILLAYLIRMGCDGDPLRRVFIRAPQCKPCGNRKNGIHTITDVSLAMLASLVLLSPALLDVWGNVPATVDFGQLHCTQPIREQ